MNTEPPPSDTVAADVDVAVAEALTRAAAISDFCAENAGIVDYDGAFPAAEFQRIAAEGLLAAPLRHKFGGFGLGTELGKTMGLLEVLRYLGRGNLSVGRIYDGHVNALHLVYTFGTADQAREASEAVLNRSALFGIWNTQAEDGVTLTPLSGKRHRLNGAKTFASGGGHVSRALITAAWPDGGKQLCLVPFDRVAPAIDPCWWQPLGMRASASFRVGFDGIEVEPQWLIGAPDDYERQPWLTGGAIRFAAVQLGGADALLEACREYLGERERGEDPYQKMRLGQMAVAAESGNLWLRGAAERLEDDAAGFYRAGAAPCEDAAVERVLAYANMTRTAIERICLDVLELAERSVGARGLLRPRPFERLVRDLRLYLRQPAPDAALAAVGHYVLGAERPVARLWRDAT